ncbi:MAG: class I SAM-dependent methyltransferase [Bacteroidales bacterium]|nr:class I SAM-dependent methyltransferase [Bacteroidales bacterium]
MEKIYPDSGVELTPLISRHYDFLMKLGSFGKYQGFINRAIKKMGIKPGDAILDLGCGTGKNACLMKKYLLADDGAKIVGMDISEVMMKQFEDNCKSSPFITFKKQRVDEPFDLGEKFDKIFISFVIHGFPHDIREKVIQNAFNHLKEGGSFFILDFSEFNMDEMPALHRMIFKKVECKYAFDYIEKNWKEILGEYGFHDFEEDLFMKNYVRLLKAVK